jgi:hypothetical protein
MFSDKEFQQVTGIDPALIPSEMEMFSWFMVDLGAAVNHDGTPMFPQLRGKSTPWWEVKLVSPEKMVEESSKAKRAANIEKYAAMVAAGQELFPDEPDTRTEWQKFFEE